MNAIARARSGRCYARCQKIRETGENRGGGVRGPGAIEPRQLQELESVILITQIMLAAALVRTFDNIRQLAIRKLHAADKVHESVQVFKITPVSGCAPQSDENPRRLHRIVRDLAARAIEIIDGFADLVPLKADAGRQKIVPADGAIEEAAVRLARIGSQQGDRSPVSFHRGDQVPALRKRIGPRAVLTLKPERGLCAFKSNVAEARRACDFIKHPVRKDPVALRLNKDVIVMPRQKIERTLDESPCAQTETHACVRAANESALVMPPQQILVQPQRRHSKLFTRRHQPSSLTQNCVTGSEGETIALSPRSE